MRPKEHMFYGGLFAIVCYVLFDVVGSFEAVVIWVASWLIIDLDHAIRYSLKTGNFNPFRFWRWSKKEGNRWDKLSKSDKILYKGPIFIFHGIEILILLFFLGTRWDVFNWILVGFVFHLILDWINLYENDEYLFGKVSFVWVFFRNIGRKLFQ